MGLHDYISETEAAHQAGVSIKTLRRFSDAGYLQVEIEPDGLRLYSKGELDEIFGAHRSGAERGSQESPLSDTGSNAEAARFQPEGQSCDTNARAQRETGAVDKASDVTVSDSYAVTEEDRPDRRAFQRDEGSDRSINTYEESATSLYAIEVLKLRNVISLQEKLLDTKDAEIADLKGQRDWLRARVEKLEEKSDRDQILLLSETQTIRKLISLQEQKPSPIHRFLDWLGINPQPTVKALGGKSDFANSDTLPPVEVSSASNG